MPVDFDVKINGLQETMTRLRKDILQLGGNACYQGLVRAGILILAEAQRYAPRDTGNLMASGFIIGHRKVMEIMTVKEAKTDFSGEVGPTEAKNIEMAVSEGQQRMMGFKSPSVMIGFGASYAWDVHEGDESLNWHDGGPRYLLKSLVENYDEVLSRVFDSVRRMR